MMVTKSENLLLQCLISETHMISVFFSYSFPQMIQIII
jgi:hypothetical protein